MNEEIIQSIEVMRENTKRLKSESRTRRITQAKEQGVEDAKLCAEVYLKTFTETFNQEVGNGLKKYFSDFGEKFKIPSSNQTQESGK